MIVKEGTHSGGPRRKKVSRTKDFGDFEGERGSDSEASKKNPGGLFFKKKRKRKKKIL